ncbi:methyltransferase domain-containing protein [Candidatus Woesearchaeota archaeon]|nr:methyltransferase domain-containing protein [Candidatus Woesearchaeota archaeon]
MKLEFFTIKSRIEKCVRDVFSDSNDKILDIGSGKMPYYHGFMKGKIVSFDIKKSDKTHVIGDADALPFKQNSFDKIIMVNSLYYFKNPFKVIERLGRILKKNGKLVIITPFLYPVHDAPTDKFRFTEYGLRTMLEGYFKVEKIEVLGGFFMLPAVIIHSLLKGLPLMAPKYLKSLTKILAYFIFYAPYLLAQLISVLNALDKSKRWATYYIAVAARK